MSRPRSSWLVGAAVFFAVTAAAADGTKVGVVDLQGAMLQTSDGMSAQASMKRYMDRRQGDLDRRQKRLKSEEIDLRRQMRFLSRQAFQKRYEHYQQRMVKAQTKYIEYNKQLQKKQAEFMQPMMQKLLGVVRRAASRRGFDIVIDRQAAPYVRADLDLTDLVVQMYNSGGGGASDGDAKAAGDAPTP
ncbi:MAG: OmpH family outer membrane protein [Myxococcota bacterium]